MRILRLEDLRCSSRGFLTNSSKIMCFFGLNKITFQTSSRIWDSGNMNHSLSGEIWTLQNKNFGKFMTLFFATSQKSMWYSFFIWTLWAMKRHEKFISSGEFLKERFWKFLLIFFFDLFFKKFFTFFWESPKRKKSRKKIHLVSTQNIFGEGLRDSSLTSPFGENRPRTPKIGISNNPEILEK